MVSRALQREAWRVLEGDSAILDVARDVSRILRETGIRGAIIGGVAVGLHGHVRATVDVDVFIPRPLEAFAEALRRSGYVFDAAKSEFRRIGALARASRSDNAVPVHLVTNDEIGFVPTEFSEISAITTVSLHDLINMKLHSGTRSVLRAQDIADVIALIRVHRLTSAFATRIEKSQRPEFRKLVKAVQTGNNR